MTLDTNDLRTPAEQLPITLFDAVVLAVRADDGSISLAVRDICQALAIDVSTQLRRVRQHAVLREGVVRFRVATAGGDQGQEFLELELVPTWLLMINAARVGEPVRPRLMWLQRYIVREVYRAFASLAGLPEQQSRQIEDLADLQRFNIAIAELADRQESLDARQGTLEQSQDQARQAWRDLRAEIRAIAARMAVIEQRVGGVITREQRGYIYQLVQAWGAAKAEREPRLSKSAAYAACWTVLKAKYRIARYEDLPAATYADCVAFIQQSYRALTGKDLDLPEQTTLDLGDS
jgi:P22_AR N-terminal domain